VALPPVPPTFAQGLLPALDTIRGIAGELGLRPYTVTVQLLTYDGPRPGTGTKVAGPVLTLFHTTGPNAQPVRVRQLSRKEIVASGGLYTDRDFKVGPMTPAYSALINQFAGGVTDAQLDAEATVYPTEVIWAMSGPGLPAAGATFQKIGEEATSLHYFVFLRQVGRQSP
jgi:hypothetical protein